MPMLKLLIIFSSNATLLPICESYVFLDGVDNSSFISKLPLSWDSFMIGIISWHASEREKQQVSMLLLLTSLVAYGDTRNSGHGPYEVILAPLYGSNPFLNTRNGKWFRAAFGLYIPEAGVQVRWVGRTCTQVKDFENGLLNELNEVKTVFNQIEAAVDQYVVNIVMHADDKSVNVLPVQNTFLDDNIALDVMKMENDRLMELLVSQDLYNENLELKAQLLKRNNKIEQDVFIELSKRYSQLEKHCISLQLAMQQSNKTLLQAKYTTISNLKKHIQELKGKSVADFRESVNKPKVIAPAVLKLDLEPLSSKLKNNRKSHMASTDNTSGPAPQRKERCTLLCTLSLEEEKSSYLRAVLSTTSICLKLTPGYISSGLVQNLVSSTPYVPPSKKDYEILFQPLFDEYFNPPPRVVSLDPVAVAAQELLIQSVQLRQLPLIKMYHLLVLLQQLGKFNL
ncbi:hypothetical protein Tco_0718980 [Tanacetum coccineum]